MLVNRTGFKRLVPSDQPQDTTLYSAPKRARFKIVEDQQDKYIVRFSYIPVATSSTPSNRGAAAGRTVVVRAEEDYWIEQENLPRFDFELHSGIDYGELTLPFKYQFKDGSITTGATVGGFIGYRWRPLFGIPTTFLLAGGFSGIPTTDVNATTVQTELGFTYATGFVFTVKDQFQVGLIFGRDHLGGSAGSRFAYEDKTWASASIGFAFIK